MTQVEDRIATRAWEIDLSLAGKVRDRKLRPANRVRQNIAKFVEREATVERFSIRQTIPYCGYEVECPPSQLQYGAVMDFFLEPCETRFQAGLLLSARDYAQAVVRGLPFTAPRRHFIWVCTTAYILADKELRSRVRSWNIARHNERCDVATGIAGHKPYKLASKFASKLIDEMRGAGAGIFG